MQNFLRFFFLFLLLGAGSAQAATSPWMQDADTSARLISAIDGTGQEKEIRLGLEVQMSPHAHTYWREPGDAGMPPTLDWTGSSNLGKATLLYPTPQAFEEQGLKVIGYEGRVLFPLLVQPQTPGQSLNLSLKLNILVCDVLCLPKEFKLKLELPTGEAATSPESAALDAAFTALPDDEKKSAGLVIAEPLLPTVVQPLPKTQPAPTPAPLSDMPLPALLLLALIGGFILNLMPCVLPVLSLKIFGMIKHNGKGHRAIRHSFLSTVAGIMFSFLLLACATIVLRASGQAFGWGIQFQQPLFLAFMIGLLTLFACNLFGFFEIILPQFILEGVNPSHHPRLAGDFATGALATLLATPCTAPFLGTAIGFALTAGPFEILAVFLALGLGMALPYLIIAIRPSFTSLLPKPGAWMLGLSRVMGLGLAVTTLWLLYVLSAQTGAQAAALVGGAMLLIGIALALRHAQILRKLAIPFVALMLLGAMGVTQIAGAPPSSALPEGAWQSFDETAIAPLVGEGKTVFVDVTADWCLTCKVNARVTLANPAVATRLFGRPNVVAMQADWTNTSDVISAFLHKHKRYGVPFNIVFGPHAPEGILLPELLTPGQVKEALDRASGCASSEGKDSSC